MWFSLVVFNLGCTLVLSKDFEKYAQIRAGDVAQLLISRSDWGQIRLWVLGRLAQLWVSVGSSHQRVQ